MRAIVQEKYGSPNVLQLGEVEKPVPRDNEVLVKIHAAAATTAHTAIRKGPLAGRMVTGIRSPKNPTPGTDLAGDIQAAGRNVT
ncbi:MAG: NAD(P)-dependent alcohol dehydrogenase, partial [Candidatus Promineifilaceae bacterium]